MTNNDRLHSKALKLCETMKRTQTEQRHYEHFRDRCKQTTADLKPILAEMQAKFEDGEQISACGSLKEWCNRYRSYGALTYARCRQILTGTNGHENRVKPLDLLKELITEVAIGSFKSVIDKAQAICARIDWSPPDWKQQMEEHETDPGNTKSAVEKKKDGKVHAVNPHDKTLTCCNKDTSEYPTAEGDAVTCGNCQSYLQAAANYEAYFQAHPAERGWHMSANEFTWMNKDGRRMVKTKRKREYTVSDKGGVIGVAGSYEAGCALTREELQPRHQGGAQ